MTVSSNYKVYKNGDANQERRTSLATVAQNAHRGMRDDAHDYFNQHGISDENIKRYMLGSGDFDRHHRLTIPILNKDGNVVYIKLWATPDYDETKTVAEALHQNVSVPEYAFYPDKVEPILVGEDQLDKSTASDILICETELDRIIALQEGIMIPVVAIGGGIKKFRDEWIEPLKNMRNIYICVNDEKEAEVLARRLAERMSNTSIYIITLPQKNGIRVSLMEYFTNKCGTADELCSKYADFYCGAKPINVSQFKEMTVQDIADVLDLTIKHDFESKVATFLVMLLAYTESDQQNVMFNADSSSGKTYICQEVSKYFPPQDIKIYGKTTPTAFYYSQSLQEKDEETGQPFINLERRILIFTEQPDTQLQENLRALLSHDNKRIPFAITNKGKNGKNTAMEGYILGFPSAFFCSANMRIDEQEQTRCLILSPENTPEKIMAGVDVSIAKNSRRDAYDATVECNEDRKLLKERVLYIKNLNIDTINISDSEYLKARFMEHQKALAPRTQRDISHFISLVKALALINAPFRMSNGKIVAINRDVDEAMRLWAPLSKSIHYGVSPQALNFYKDIILPVYNTKNSGVSQAKGVTYGEISQEYYDQTGRYPNMDNIRKQYIPALASAALVSCDKDEDDKRRQLITPLVFFEDETLENKQKP